LQIKVNDNIILVGTAHISKDSVEEVRRVIEECLKGNNAYFMLAQTFLASIQRKLGREHGVEPGSEMIAAMQEAEKHNVEVALVDRDISVTLKRAWKKMGFREKTRLTWEFLKAMIGFDEEELEELDLEELMDQDVISQLMEEFGQMAPSVATVLIHERDVYIAKKIFDESKKGKVVAVVGAGHLQGIKKHLESNDFENVNLKELEYVPKKRIKVGKTVAYAIPVLFVALIAWLLFTRGTSAWIDIKDIFLWWFLINGVLSAIGAAIARGHPLTILTAFVAAPLTSLNPAVAAGWVAGYVEAKLRTPKMKDFQDMSKLESLKDFWNNKVIRLLMVVALANMGSMIGTFVAGTKIFHIVFG